MTVDERLHVGDRAYFRVACQVAILPYLGPWHQQAERGDGKHQIAENDPGNIIQYLYEQRQKFYERLKTFDTFGKGWTRRNQETLKAALEMAHET